MVEFAEQYVIRSIELLDASAWAAIYFLERRLDYGSRSMYRSAWSMQKDVLGVEHLSTLDLMAKLASTYRDQKR